MRHNLCKLCNEPSKETVSISLLTKAKYVQNVQSRRVILVRVKLYAYNELALSDICNNRCLSRLGCAVPNYISVKKNSLNPAGRRGPRHICLSYLCLWAIGTRYALLATWSKQATAYYVAITSICNLSDLHVSSTIFKTFQKGNPSFI